MAKPRIFISSTYYDLRHIRNDLERFVKELGYEPILSERGQIAYGKNEPLEQYCYREINNCDILINIVGGTYGSASSRNPYSVSQIELKTAYELHKQIYIFVERSVHVEYRTYLKNENNKEFSPQYVSDIKIYEFLKEVYNYPSNNTIAEFDSVDEIIKYLREQWAGLFQRFLQDDSRREEYKISSNLKATVETLSKIIEYTTRERDETIRNSILSYHPIFTQISDATRIPIRIFFTNKKELDALLRIFGYEELENENNDNSEITYERQDSSEIVKILISKDVFDDGNNLKPIKNKELDRIFIEVIRDEVNGDLEGINLDDLPF